MTTPRRSDVQSAAAHWDRAFRDWASVEQRSSSYALASPLYQQRYINGHFGADAPDWIEALRRKLKREVPFERALVLGCGLGDGLLYLHHRRVAKRIHGIDISAAAIEDSRTAARLSGLHEQVTFEVGDFHDCALEPDAFDLVLMVMSLHHALDLDLVLERVRSALVPGGMFVANEYVGPNRWQHTRLQLLLVNAMLARMPRALRKKADGSLKERVERPTVAAMLAMDPSEAAHSQEIPEAIERFFELLLRIDYGGAISISVLDEIIGNFREEDRSSMRWFRAVVALDRLAHGARLVPSANAFLVGRKALS